jgi:HD-like signal output (HDOD) protein
MSPATQHPTMAELRRFSTLRGIDQKTLHMLADRLVILRAQRGAILLEQGNREAHTLYLLEGRVRLTAADGKVEEFDHHDHMAHDPIARLRPSHYRVEALGQVSYLWIDNSLLESVEPHHDASPLLDSYEVSEEDEFVGMSAENRLLIRIYEDINADSLRLPTLPLVAQRIGNAVQDPTLDADKLAKVISVDPAITSKLLKLANSSRFGSGEPLVTLPEAITRLGVDNTHKQVLALSTQQLFRSGSDTLTHHMRDLWQHSRRVAAISHVLACKLGDSFDPHFALLAGLLHDIGVIAILSYARDYPELAQAEQLLDEAIHHLRGQLGAAIIRHWLLPEALVQVAEEADDWDRNPGKHADYVDLIIIAQLHSFVGTHQAHAVPHLNEVPAYYKLALGALTPDASLQMLEEADHEIREVEQLLGD